MTSGAEYRIHGEFYLDGRCVLLLSISLLHLRHRSAVEALDDKQVPAIAGSREVSPNPLDSPLTSLGDISDGDPPSVARARTTLPPKRLREAVSLSLSGFHLDGETLSDVPFSSCQIPYKPDTSALDHLAMLADGYYEQYRVEKLPVLEVPTKPRLILKLGDDPSASPATATLDKGKGRATPETYPGNLPNYPSTTGSLSGKKVSTPSNDDSLSSAQLPRTSDSSTRAASTPKKQNKRSPTPPAEFAVTSKDDLKALMHVRKMLTGATGASLDPSTRAALVGFIEGNPIMVIFLSPGP